ncbi:hypothetical protein [Kitasatospora mediocidica]|uniref:hypothetical protein n=1 Tax=Kitasatospora mediocidica TaxID=58352 RepID=UPI00055DA6CD|nr:hypothetical protein [Kitasatospora mediocidica]
MTVIRLLGAALLAHELLYLTRDGEEYLRRCFVPTLGLRLGSRAHYALHVAFMAVCAWMAVQPSAVAAHLAVFVLLVLVIASYSLRVSNHLVLGAFMLAAVLAADGLRAAGGSEQQSRALVIVSVQWLMIITYLAAFTHKLNRSFLSLDGYAGTFAAFMCWDRGVQAPWLVQLARRYAVVSTLVYELGIPVLLMVPQTRYTGVLAGIVFHFGLALLGIVNFSAVMYAGLAAFLPTALSSSWPVPHSATGFAVAGVVACVMVWLITPRRANRQLPYRHRGVAWVIQTCFGLLTAWFVVEIVQALTGPSAWHPGSPDAGGAWPAAAVLLALYTVNGLAPYLGLKTEFSMTMFSNLHCKDWNHLVFPGRWRLWQLARYLCVDSVEGLPGADEIDRADGAAELARTVLSQPQDYEYRPYFFFEALERVCRAATRPAEVTVAVRYRGRSYTVTARGGTGAESLRPEGFPRWWRLNLFPFVLPTSTSAPHSEQGSVLSSDRERQLF